jgi:hypothetical protein
MTTLVHPVAVYVGCGNDIRRPFQSLTEVREFIMVDYEGSPKFLREIASEAFLEDLEIYPGNLLHGPIGIDEVSREMNPLIFRHPTTGRLIKYYHSIVFPNNNISPYYNRGIHIFPTEIIREDIGRAQTIICAGHNPHSDLIHMMDYRDGLDFVGYCSSVYSIKCEEDSDYDGNNILMFLDSNPNYVRKIIGFPYTNISQSDIEYFNEEEIEPYNRYLFNNFEDLNDFAYMHFMDKIRQ